MRSSLSPLAVVLLCGVVALLPAANTVSTTIDPDTWWHLATGRLIADTGHLPTDEPFSRIGRESPRPWRAYSWLYEIGLFQAYQAGGSDGVRWSRTILCAASAAGLAAFAIRRGAGTTAGVMVAALAPIPLLPLCTERPWHLSIVLAVIVAWAVTSARESGSVWRVAWLPAVFVVWANVHIQFVMGWGILGLACLFPGAASRWRLIALTVACFAAVLVNPYSWHLFHIIWQYTQESAALAYIDEMQAPDPRKVWTLVVAGLLVWAGWQSVRRRPIDPFAVAMVLAGIAFTIRSQRDLWFGVLAAITALRPAPPADRRLVWVVPAAVVAAFLAVRTAASIGGFGNVEEPAKFPVAAVEHIRGQHYRGPLFNDFDWGGYLVWALPEYPVSLDGRTNVYGDTRMFACFATWNTTTGWPHDPDLAVANLVVARADTKLVIAFREVPDIWQIVYEDKVAIVFVRRTPVP